MRLARILRWVAFVLLVGAIVARWFFEKSHDTFSVLLLLSCGTSITAETLRRRALPPEKPVPWL